ncbi:hypothetical protein [Streptomyces sp. NPDC088785]|uniref:hypothetical protein n=1 Tax=Streptomyces sp. NPDC088785 TaxID=3365897 RepID=UPI0038084FBB
MNILVGIIIAAFGLFMAIAGPGLARTLGTRAGRRFEGSNTVAFRLIGTALAVLGILFAAGVVGSA